jgi:hypothetical protein
MAKAAVAKKEDVLDVSEMGNVFDLKDNMEGGEARLPQIKIIHQAQLFEMPDGKKVPEIEGTILDLNRLNAWWKESFDQTGGGSPPDCFSMDGVTPDPFSGDKQAKECPGCVQNQYGSDGGRGKACKNAKRLHIMQDGEMLPYRLTIPPSNLKAVDLYVSLLTSKAIPYQLVRTKIKLKKVQNKDGIAYAEMVFENVSMVDTKEAAFRIKKLRDEFMTVMRGQPIKVDENSYPE